MANKGYPICVIGSHGVGKTCLLKKRENDDFAPINDNVPAPTIGSEMYRIVENINGNEIKLDVSDTSGQDMFATAMPYIVKKCYCAILCFDPTDSECLTKMEDFKKRFLELNEKDGEIIYVATKCDIWGELPQDVKIFIESNDVISTSAMRGDNVHTPFIRAAEFCSVNPLPNEEPQPIPKPEKKKSFCGF